MDTRLLSLFQFSVYSEQNPYYSPLWSGRQNRAGRRCTGSDQPATLAGPI